MGIESCFRKIVLPAVVVAGTVSLAGPAFGQTNQAVVPDAQVEASVLKALASAPELATQSISTTTVYGTVTLSGSVRTEAMRHRAEQLAATTPGVKKVVDELTLGGGGQEGSQAAVMNPGGTDGITQAGNSDGRVLQSDGTYANPADLAAQQDGVAMQGQQGSQNGQEVPPRNGPDTDAYGRPLNGQQAQGLGGPQQPGYPGQPQPGYPAQSQQPGYADQQGYPGATQGYPGQQQAGNGPYGVYPGNLQGYPPQGYPHGGYGQAPYRQPPMPPNGGRYGAPPQAGYAQPYGQGYGQGQVGGQAATIPAGTALHVRVNQHLNSRDIKAGTPFDAMVIEDIVADGQVAIPRGAFVEGTVVDAESTGVLKGRGELGLQLTQVTLGGATYPLVSNVFAAHGGDKTIQTVNSTLGLGALGAIFGAVAGGGAGAAIGAGVGGAVGLGASAASGHGNVFIPSEAVLTFRLAQPVTVTTVSQAEMQRLGYGVPGGGPRGPLMVRRYPYYGPVYYPRFFYRPYGYYPY